MATPSFALDTIQKSGATLRGSSDAIKSKTITTRMFQTETATRTIRGIAINNWFSPYDFEFNYDTGSNSSLGANKSLIFVHPEAGSKIVGWSFFQNSNLPAGTFQLYQLKVDGTNTAIGGTDSAGRFSENFFTGVTVEEGDFFYLACSGSWTTNLGNMTLIKLFFE